jgi:hypothetical protein
MGNPVGVHEAKPCSDINLAQSGLFAVKTKHIGDCLFCGHGEDIKRIWITRKTGRLAISGKCSGYVVRITYLFAGLSGLFLFRSQEPKTISARRSSVSRKASISSSERLSARSPSDFLNSSNGIMQRENLVYLPYPIIPLTNSCFEWMLDLVFYQKRQIVDDLQPLSYGIFDGVPTQTV